MSLLYRFKTEKQGCSGQPHMAGDFRERDEKDHPVGRTRYAGLSKERATNPTNIVIKYTSYSMAVIFFRETGEVLCPKESKRSF
jgi:hypothetical protein